MAKIVWDTQQMHDASEAYRRTADELAGVSGRLAGDLGSLDAVRHALARYGIRPHSLEAMGEQRPSRALGQVARRVEERSQELGALVGLLNEIEREAEARNGRIHGQLSPQFLARVDQQRKELLGDERLSLLLGLRSLVERESRPPAESANAVRLWLETTVPDTATRAWIVQNSPDVARLLAENVDEADNAVRELRAATTRPGTHPYDYFLSLSAERREWLAVAYPSLIGNLDGAPANMRGLANKVNLVAYRERLFDDLAQSQLQGYRVANRDEAAVALRLQGIDWLLATPAGDHVLAFDRPDSTTQMKVIVDESAVGGKAMADATRLMHELAAQAGTQQGYSQALLSDLDSLSQSSDPAVAKFGRETADELRTTGQIDADKAADLLGKADYPLALLGAIADAGQRIDSGQKPPDAVANAFGQAAAGFGAGYGASAMCVAAGPGAVPCALVGVGTGIAAEELYQVVEDHNTYVFTPAPGDAGSDHKYALVAGGPKTGYDPSKYFIPPPPPKPPLSGGQYPAVP